MSCPCQPFSSAGKGKGTADERHLWPAAHHLIRECRPVTVFGEQVANKAGESWFDIVRTDLEKEDYTAGLAVFPACGVGAPHIRKRLYWVGANLLANNASSDSMADTDISEWRSEQRSHECERTERREPNGDSSEFISMADTDSQGPQGHARHGNGSDEPGREQEEQAGSVGESGASDRPGPTNGHWRDADWLGCRDGKWRPVKPGTFPLVNGAPARVGSGGNPGLEEVESTKEARVMRLKGYGNAIVAQQAQVFISAYIDILADDATWK